MFKFIKKLFGKKEVEVIQPIPQPKPQHCALHKRYMKSCLACQEAIK